jgi:hypothetical protein
MLKIGTWNVPEHSRTITLNFYGTERTGKEVFFDRVEDNLVYFRFSQTGPLYWANRGEFRAATGTEKQLKALVRHQDKMFIKNLWQGGRAKAREAGLRSWYVS